MTSFPVRTARPGEKWWPWRHLVSIDERRRDGLIDKEDSAMMDALDKAESSYYGLSDDDPSRNLYFLSDLEDDEDEDHYEDDNDPDDDEDPPPDETPDDDQHPPDSTITPNPPVIPAPSPSPDPQTVIPEKSGIHPAAGRGGPHPDLPPPPPPEPPFTPIQSGAPNYWETDSFSSHVDPTDPSPDCPDPNPHPKPRVARGRPPP